MTFRATSPLNSTPTKLHPKSYLFFRLFHLKICSFPNFTQSCLSTPKLSSCSVAEVSPRGKEKGLYAAALLPFTQTPPTHADGLPRVPNTKSQTPPFGIQEPPKVATPHPTRPHPAAARLRASESLSKPSPRMDPRSSWGSGTSPAPSPTIPSPPHHPRA